MYIFRNDAPRLSFWDRPNSLIKKYMECEPSALRLHATKRSVSLAISGEPNQTMILWEKNKNRYLADDTQTCISFRLSLQKDAWYSACDMFIKLGQGSLQSIDDKQVALWDDQIISKKTWGEKKSTDTNKQCLIYIVGTGRAAQQLLNLLKRACMSQVSTKSQNAMSHSSHDHRSCSSGFMR